MKRGLKGGPAPCLMASISGCKDYPDEKGTESFKAGAFLFLKFLMQGLPR